MESPSQSQPVSHGDFALPSGPNFHPSSSTGPLHPQRKSWQAPSISSLRSVRSNASRREGQEPVAREQSRAASDATSKTARWWRIRFFRGMVNDIKRRAPYYWSDWADAWDYRVVPATIYMYFAKYGPQSMQQIFFSSLLPSLSTQIFSLPIPLNLL